MSIQEMNAEPSGNTGAASYSQTSYVESPFSEANWEVVGPEGNKAVFMPQRFEVLKSDFVKLDPMFADYGGGAKGEEREQFREHQPKLGRDSSNEAMIDSTKANAEDQSVHGATEVDAIPSISVTEDALQELLLKAREEERVKVTQELEQLFKEQLAAGEMKLQETLNDLSTQLNNEIARVEQSSIDLVLNIADKIVGASIEVNPEYILPIVKEAIALTGAATIRRILVGKDDFEFLTVLGFDRQFKGNGAGWNFELDDSIRMGCIVETSAGEVDYELDQAWERVKDSLLKARAFEKV